jgi:hypothetical protein
LLSSTCPLSCNFASKQRACAGANDGADGAITVIINRAPDECTPNPADDKANGSIAPAAMEAAIFAAPFASAVLGIGLANRDCKGGRRKRQRRR